MKITRLVLAALLATLLSPAIYAQDKEKKPETPAADASAKPPASVPLKVQVVLTEFDGAQKLSSMPYVLHLTTGRGQNGASLRLQESIPVGSTNNYNFQSVGTTIDCGASRRSDGQYELAFSIGRSSFSTPAEDSKDAGSKADQSSFEPHVPSTRSSTDSFQLVMRDGQTMEGMSAVDPTTGHVLKAEVTLTVLK